MTDKAKGRIGKVKYKSYNKKKWFPRQFVKLIAGLVLLMVLGYTVVQMTPLRSLNLGIEEADTSLGWNLILVNKDYKIPSGYDPELTELSNGQKVDSRIYPQLQKMFDDARAAGLELFVREGYRTTQEQQKIMDEKIEEYRAEGYSNSEAKELAEKYVAIPGTSEHQLGLSVDINADTSKCSSDAVYAWLAENAYKYGFIKRYPSEKVEITGINNEPWHYRYVGTEAAAQMQESGLCLEEYIEQLKP
ncbi:M15 family metallopeptidase [Agathobacter sp.]|uniref:M15 family metallopeptidase n=1 Tax=Agathobacter sp. TaxID=2021311 RepID=UPI003FD78CA8